jgi:hypothetical protein
MKEETIKREKKEEREIIKERRDKRGRKRELMKREACASHLAIARPAGRPPTHSANINYNYKYYSANLNVNTKLTLVPPISLSLDPPGRPPIAAHTAAPLPGMSIFLFFLPLTAKNLLVN